MSIHSTVTRWRNISYFCARRVADYGELFSIELQQTRRSLVREVIAFVALAVAGLFTLSFFSIAIIASAWGTPYFLAVVWGVAGAWLLLSLISLAVLRMQDPGRPFRVLEEEVRRDLETIRESLK
ncbi:phage holin family protein [Paraburkholderia diazotrophica]|uniref:phage holin family protein n=1 Tax=Paraburkholderia diazotrophica TaxID=667676 RepID=UPI003172B88F